jgi:hypothetical protein
MRFRWVKCPRGYSHHTTSGNRRGIRFGDASEHRGNLPRWLPIGTGAISLPVSGECRICQRPCCLEKRGSGERRHHEYVLPAGG